MLLYLDLSDCIGLGGDHPVNKGPVTAQVRPLARSRLTLQAVEQRVDVADDWLRSRAAVHDVVVE